MTMANREGGYLSRPAARGRADVVEVILGKGIVIDAYVRVSLVGIELLTIDARIVIASVDTYLRFAEATDRLNLYEHGGKDLPDLFNSMEEGGAKHKTKGALSGVKEKVSDAIGSGDENGSGSSSNGSGRRRASSGSRRRRSDDDE